jgi:hypothetical protein
LTYSRQQLRDVARLALQHRGYEVEVTTVAGVAPGARLTATRGRKSALNIAVRTSQKREVGLVPREKGGWKTASSVDQIIAAVPSKSPNKIEVFCFETGTLVKAFDDYVRKYVRTTEPGVPVFIPLDNQTKRSGLTKVGLKELAQWVHEFRVDELDKQSKCKQLELFIERVTREFADLTGVDSARVTIDFRISSMPRVKTPQSENSVRLQAYAERVRKPGE